MSPPPSIGVVAGAAVDTVAADLRQDEVRAVAAEEQIVAGPAVEGIVVEAAVERVGAFAAVQDVVEGEARDQVVQTAAVQGVVHEIAAVDDRHDVPLLSNDCGSNANARRSIPSRRTSLAKPGSPSQ